ncbi:hypothetical protein B0H14DRAFT_3468612 [Mycena olivaceomarginata]|nr:hypothetical protein B0H14DRAFT_3468612 [Mycena olivaceomarginata]
MSSSILILGATGVRSRAKIPAGIEKQARVVEGSLADQDALLNAMDGVDTVMSFLGAYPSFTPRSGMRSPGYFLQCGRNLRPVDAIVLPRPVRSEVFPFGWSAYALMPKVLVPQGNVEMVVIAEAVGEELN